MKAAIIGVLFLVVVGVGGFFAYSFVSQSQGEQEQIETTTDPVVKIGTLQTAAGDDYTHILLTPEGTVKVNSPVVDLEQYVGKKIQLEGEYSGTTLFVDSAIEAP